MLGVTSFNRHLQVRVHEPKSTQYNQSRNGDMFSMAIVELVLQASSRNMCVDVGINIGRNWLMKMSKGTL